MNIKIFLYLLLSVNLLHAAQIKLMQEEAVEGENFTIVVAAQGKEIKFLPIDTIGGYDIVKKEQVINTVFINKNVAYEKRLVLTIQPTQPFEIDPVEVMVDGVKEKTQKVTVNVKKARDLTTDKYFITLKAHKNEVFQHEPVQITMQLFELKEKRLLDLLYSPPSKDNFFVKQLGQERSYVENKYVVHEMQYLYYPQVEGNLTIKGAQARIGIPVKAKDMFGQTLIPKHKVIESNDIVINVKPVNEDVDLVGQVTMQTALNGTSLKENEPLFFEITLSGKANFDDFKGFKIEINDATVYEGETKISHNGFKQSFSIVSNKSFKIPVLSVKVFDTKEQKVKTIASKEYQVSIETEKKETVKEIIVQKEVISWQIVVLSFFIGTITTVLSGLVIYKYKSKEKIKKTKFQELVPFSQEDEVYRLLKQLYKTKKGKSDIDIKDKKIKEILQKYKKSI